MTERICELPDCDELRWQAKRYCASHYMKKYRYGDPYYKYQPPFVDLTDQQFGHLTVLSRTADGRWLCRCDCGSMTTVRAGCLRRGTTASCNNRVIHHRRDLVKYAGAHDRVEAERGRAREHQCVDCGATAAHWSYDHADPDERYEELIGCIAAYSMKPRHYQPRCAKCHRRFDVAHKHALRL